MQVEKVKKRRQIASIALLNEEKFLLQLRDNIPTILAPNHWALLGGGIEQGESPEEAVKREINEEIDCKIFDVQFVDLIKIRNHPQFGEEDLYLFKGKINKPLKEITLFEGQRLGYFSIKEMKSLLMPDIVKEYLVKNISKFIVLSSVQDLAQRKT